ncbi:arsenate reductase/protein-tyrosine-phosphatase family protein [Enterobacter sp. C4G1]|uniref:arsenate reductase/protein-tyrosine-phosphatase family protein n=1 Tax=Enterobacter sp. C4G1 TaxID=3458724 RepID=UPI0040678198
MATMIIQSILVVCTGNICRSPAGERLLQKYFPLIRIESAGINGLEGQAADCCAADTILQYGVSLQGHVARKLTHAMMRQSDLILVMESRQLNYISAIAPEMRGKSLLFGRWLDNKEIPDPYCKSPDAFEYVFDLLVRASQEWARRLNR